ncbi:hypothetical protein E2C01_049603 [Portunus trituberculatus]|uniref:Uncharacterized protein n=1 Tax=Portunus trituberculatus TaxID=210409 RepID=A0A5B7G6V1_PORTR|nr:hypothetical protein [Portunus trituberculatus]
MQLVLFVRECVSAVIICDSKPALQSFSALVVQQILSFLSLLPVHDLSVKFIWVPSHIGLRHNTTVDRLAKEACRLPLCGAGHSLSLPCYLGRIRSAAFLPGQCRRGVERPYSVTINHYVSVCRSPYSYLRRGLMVRRHNVVSVRLRLGNRPPWQVAGVVGEPAYVACRLCHAPQANTIEHYCVAYPAVRHLLPQGLPLDAVCRHLLPHDVLDELLVRFPRFGGFS